MIIVFLAARAAFHSVDRSTLQHSLLESGVSEGCVGRIRAYDKLSPLFLVSIYI